MSAARLGPDEGRGAPASDAVVSGVEAVLEMTNAVLNGDGLSPDARIALVGRAIRAVVQMVGAAVAERAHDQTTRTERSYDDVGKSAFRMRRLRTKRKLQRDSSAAANDAGMAPMTGRPSPSPSQPAPADTAAPSPGDVTAASPGDVTVPPRLSLSSEDLINKRERGAAVVTPDDALPPELADVARLPECEVSDVAGTWRKFVAHKAGLPWPKARGAWQKWLVDELRHEREHGRAPPPPVTAPRTAAVPPKKTLGGALERARCIADAKREDVVPPPQAFMMALGGLRKAVTRPGDTGDAMPTMVVPCASVGAESS